MAVPAFDLGCDPHIPVLLQPLMEQVSPVSGVWLDGTFGAGGYSRALLAAGAERVIAVDRDPEVFAYAGELVRTYGHRLRLVEGKFADLDRITDVPLDGITLDLGVSSMQLDNAERGFSFAADGPLDMRMGRQSGTAADLVNRLDEGELADILHAYGEERAARRIARAIVHRRTREPITRTLELVSAIQGCLARSRSDRSHPATRTFQALRVAVNNEFEQLVDGLEAAERALKPGGILAVVTFHSIEDRLVKRFFRQRSGRERQGSRHAPPKLGMAARFRQRTQSPIQPDERELEHNRRSRSAKLRLGIRTSAEAGHCDRVALGLPTIKGRVMEQ